MHLSPYTRAIGALTFVLSICAAAPAFAADPVVAPEALRAAALAKKSTETDTLWTHKLTLGATGSAASSSNVVGAVDGATYQVGLLLEGELNYVRGSHDWHNSLKVQQSQSRTPVIDSWVKASDNVELASTYLFRLRSIPWIGPFARAKLQTQLLSSYDIRATSSTVKYQDSAGVEQRSESVDAEVRTKTSGSFEPLLINSSVGFFANPVEGKKLTFKAKAGAGTQHIIAGDDAYAVAGFDKDTATVTLKQIATTTQAGAEVELEANGALTKTLSYKAKSRFFYPLYSTSAAKFEGLDALSTEVTAGVSVKLAKWASLDYVATIKRIPLVLDQWQVQHGLLLTSGFNLL